MNNVWTHKNHHTFVHKTERDANWSTCSAPTDYLEHPWTILNPTEMGSGWLAQSRAHPRINRYSNMNERASRSSMALLWNANTSRITSQAANITVPYSNYFKLLILLWGNPSRERNAPEHLRHLLSLKKNLPAKLQHRLLNANPEWSAWLLGAKTGNPTKLACISVSTCVSRITVKKMPKVSNNVKIMSNIALGSSLGKTSPWDEQWSVSVRTLCICMWHGVSMC